MLTSHLYCLLEGLTELQARREVKEIWYMAVTHGTDRHVVLTAEDEARSIVKRWFQLDVTEQNVADLGWRRTNVLTCY